MRTSELTPPPSLPSQGCYNGPNRLRGMPLAVNAQCGGDNDVDWADMGIFQCCRSCGSIPANQICAG